MAKMFDNKIRHSAKKTSAVMLSFFTVLLCSAPADAKSLTATFDSFSEGDTGASFIDGGITFSDLDQRIDGGSNDGFVIESTDSELFEPAFSLPNYLTTSGFTPDTGFGGGRFGSALITPQIMGTSASIGIFSLPDNSPNILTLEALLNDVPVATSNSISFNDFSSGPLFQTLTISNVRFDELKLVASGSQDNGVVFIGIDNVSIKGVDGDDAASVPEPSSLFFLSSGVFGLLSYSRRRR